MLHALTVHSVYVSDNGSNMILALSDFKQIPCACHMLATVLSNTLQTKSLSKVCFPLDVGDPMATLRDTNCGSLMFC